MKNECQVERYQKSTIYNFTVEGIEFQTKGYQVISLDTLFLQISCYYIGKFRYSRFLKRMFAKKWISGGCEIMSISENLAKQVLEYINENEPPRKEE